MLQLHYKQQVTMLTSTAYNDLYHRINYSYLSHIFTLNIIVHRTDDTYKLDANNLYINDFTL